MTLLKILVLAAIQGACELLPVSSSAHVILAEKLMGLDPTAPEMTLLLVMLHTGTMFAVIVYFWSSWREAYFRSAEALRNTVKLVVVATALTGVVGLILLVLIERVLLRGTGHDEVEHLFGNFYVISAGLAAVGLMIIASGRLRYQPEGEGEPADGEGRALDVRISAWIGAVQGLCLPFRGFSRSGSTISTGLFLGAGKRRVEEFSFALVIVLTPPVIAREVYRLIEHQGSLLHGGALLHLFWPSLVGMACSFVAGLGALRWLSRWLEHGRWQYFGYYCLVASVVMLMAARLFS